jgi:hypothetical protein
MATGQRLGLAYRHQVHERVVRMVQICLIHVGRDCEEDYCESCSTECVREIPMMPTSQCRILIIPMVTLRQTFCSAAPRAIFLRSPHFTPLRDCVMDVL